jgi:RNase P subunit RPR2
VKILRSGLSQYPGLAPDENGAWKTTCPGCKQDIRPSKDDVLHIESEGKPCIAVTCGQCLCIFQVDEKEAE